MATVIVAMADKKMRIRCEETGESFEVIVPDGLRIYEFNGNWFDSIKSDLSAFAPIVMNKIRFLYSEFGIRKYKKTVKADTADGYAEDATVQDVEDRRKAVEYLLKADELGVLSNDAARIILDYSINDSTSDCVRLNEEDWIRIQRITNR